MSRYLDPKADVVFKKIFGEHPKLLISFLNALLPLPANSPIVSLTYLQNEQVPVIPEFKRTIADVKCTDAQGRVFIVEMQMNWTDHFKQRLLFGTSQAFVKQLEKGEEYKFLQPVYGLGIVAEIYEKTTIVSKDLLAIPEIAQAIELAEESAYAPAELNLYESYWDQVSREKTLIMDKYAEGLIEGEAKGIEKIAINMLIDNEPLDKISTFTSLSQDEVVKLKNKL